MLENLKWLFSGCSLPQMWKRIEDELALKGLVRLEGPHKEWIWKALIYQRKHEFGIFLPFTSATNLEFYLRPSFNILRA